MEAHPFKALRERAGLSQAELGEKLGLLPHPQGRVSHYETGRRAIPVDVAMRFLAVARAHGAEYSLEDIYAASASVSGDVERTA